MSKKKIRVLVIDDSVVFRETLARGLVQDATIEVVGTVQDAYSALRLIKELLPDVIIADVEMPGMDGIDFVKELLKSYIVPVVMVSSLDKRIFEALSAGAVDFVVKPNYDSMGIKAFLNELAVKVKIAAVSKVSKISKGTFQDKKQNGDCMSNTKLIAIGASTGGTEAILQVLQNLPRNIPGIVIVQHIPPVFSRMFAERMDKLCQLSVKEAADGEKVTRGNVLVAPGDSHMTVVKDKEGIYVKCKPGEKVSGHCPSVDVLFNSVAETVGKEAIGIILTGMGSDGAKGLLNMRQNGAVTMGQDENSCVVYGMPMQAYKLGAVSKQLQLGKIADEIMKSI